MSNPETTLKKILSAEADANISFRDLRRALHYLGFTERIHGSHHVFTTPDIVDIVNIQSRRGKAKPYQVRQIRKLIVRHRLGGQSHAE